MARSKPSTNVGFATANSSPCPTQLANIAIEKGMITIHYVGQTFGLCCMKNCAGLTVPETRSVPGTLLWIWPELTASIISS